MISVKRSSDASRRLCRARRSDTKYALNFKLYFLYLLEDKEVDYNGFSASRGSAEQEVALNTP